MPLWLTPMAGVALIVVGTGCRRESARASPLLRARAPSGAEVHWTLDAVVLEPIAPPLESGVTARELVDALSTGARAWNEALEGCAGPRLHVGPSRLNGAARVDGHNVVVIRSSSWCPADRRPTEPCYEPSNQATTEVRPRDEVTGPHAGEILEADIEVNAVNFRWSLDGQTPGTRSLRAVLAHELGHVLGLAHSCAGRRTGPAASGGAVVDCAAAGASSSIMYPDPTEPGRAVVLEPGLDAVQGLCGSIGSGRRDGCRRP